MLGAKEHMPGQESQRQLPYVLHCSEGKPPSAPGSCQTYGCSPRVPGRTSTHSAPSAVWMSHKPSSPCAFLGSKGHTSQSPQVAGAGDGCRYPQPCLKEANGGDDRAIPTFL